MHEKARELIEARERGWFTRGELTRKLIELSLEVEPSEYLSDLPEAMKSEIKKDVRSPPASVEDVILIRYPTFGSGTDEEKARRKIDEAYYESYWKVHRYFYGS